MQYIATLNGRKFLIESNSILTQEQVSSHVINHLSHIGETSITNLGTATCGGPYGLNTTHALTGSVTSGGTAPFTYTWTITLPTGSDETYTGASKTYTFTQVGTYTIKLKVTDSCASGAKTDTSTCNVTITTCINPSCEVDIA